MLCVYDKLIPILWKKDPVLAAQVVCHLILMPLHRAVYECDQYVLTSNKGKPVPMPSIT